MNKVSSLIAVPHEGYSFQSFSSADKLWQQIVRSLSCRRWGRNRNGEGKKGKDPNDTSRSGHFWHSVYERTNSFGDGAKSWTISIFGSKSRNWYLKKLLAENVHLRSEMLIFFKLCRSASVAGSARLEKNWGLLISRRSYNKCWGFQPCAHWECSMWVEVCEVRIAMVSNNKPLDWDMISIPISQLIEVLLAWWQVDQILPKFLDESRWGVLGVVGDMEEYLFVQLPGLSLLDCVLLLWSLGQVGYGIVNALLEERQ